MAQGNFTVFQAKHVTGLLFGNTAIPEADMTGTATSMVNSFATNCGVGVLDLTGSADALNPTASAAFAKDFTVSGNERTSSEESLLGADSQGSQNTELMFGSNSKMVVEFTCVYRNPKTTGIFSDTTKTCLIKMDNSESSTTGELYIMFTNLTMDHVGSLSRNADGLMEQKIKFSIRGGLAGSAITVTDTNTYYKQRLGLDYVEEIRTA